MRILVVSQYFWPEGFRINELVKDLRDRGHDVVVLTGKPNYPDGTIFQTFKDDPRKFDAYAGATIVRIPVVPRGSTKLRLFLNYISFVVSGLSVGAWRLRDQHFDAILVFQVSPITAALPALLQRRLKRAPIAMWILDLWPDTLSAVGVIRSPRALSLVSKLVAFVYRRCDCILVQSRAFISSVVQHGREASSVRYFPAWAEATFELDLATVEPASEIAEFKNTFNVMFAGNIGEAQDFPAILAAADALRDRPDLRWLIVGDGRAAESVRAEIAKRRLEDQVVMLGRHAFERMPNFFKCADALLVTLKSEPVFAMTIPGKVQSYLRSGVPILGMLDGEGARVIEESGAGMVCSAGDSQELARIVTELAKKSVDERAKMGAKGRAYCEKNFDRALLLNRLNDWLAELATSPTRPA